MISAVIAISVGASAGAVIRWLLGLALNGLVPSIPLGTLVANLAGGYLAGLALALFIQFPQLHPHWRLLVMTGFLGSLTTFSAFSTEVITHLQHGRPAMAAILVTLHLAGALLMTAFGFATIRS